MHNYTLEPNSKNCRPKCCSLDEFKIYLGPHRNRMNFNRWPIIPYKKISGDFQNIPRRGERVSKLSHSDRKFIGELEI